MRFALCCYWVWILKGREDLMASASEPTKVSWSPSATRRDTRMSSKHEGSVEYVLIKLSDLSNFEDLISEEKWGGNAIYKAVWTREDGSTKEVAAKRLPKLNEKEVRYLAMINFSVAIVSLAISSDHSCQLSS